MFALIDRPSAIPNAVGFAIASDAAVLRDAICFENVRFAYPTRPSERVLDGLSLRVPAGASMAIVGASAALHLSGIPWEGPVAGVRVGRVQGELIVTRL